MKVFSFYGEKRRIHLKMTFLVEERERENNFRLLENDCKVNENRGSVISYDRSDIGRTASYYYLRVCCLHRDMTFFVLLLVGLSRQTDASIPISMVGGIDSL